METAINCKKCTQVNIRKSGKVRGKQRYECKNCGCNFVIGDERTNHKIVALKALVVIFYALGKGSYNMLGKIFKRDPSLIYRWIKEAGLVLEEPIPSADIKEIEFDELWHFIGSKKINSGSLKPLTVAQGELLHGYLVTVILQPLDDSTTN